MGLFSKKPEPRKEENEDRKQKVEELFVLNVEFRNKEIELKEIIDKIKNVKTEYDLIVNNLMSVKKEHIQKKTELAVSVKELNEINEKIKSSQSIKKSLESTELKNAQEKLKKANEDFEKASSELSKINEDLQSEQSSLVEIRRQQVEVQKELESANAQLYDAKQQLSKNQTSDKKEVLSPEEKQIMNISGKDKSGVIEAASIVVGSLKSKLTKTQKEMESLQDMLEKERAEHEKTKLELKKLVEKLR
jgi:chromosome segregation ATPase